MALRAYRGTLPTLGARVYVDPHALLVGRVSMAEDSSIWPFALARGDVNYIQIGARSNVQDGSVLHVVHDSEAVPGGLPLIIGEDVTVGHKAMLHAARIGSRCLIGMAAVVLDGAVIEDEVLLAAGSLVPPGKRLESGGLYLGNPAKRVRDLKVSEIEKLVYSAHHYVQLKNEYLDETPASGGLPAGGSLP